MKFTFKNVKQINKRGDGPNYFDIIGEEDMECSDGYHTFTELYDHRITLFIALCKYISDSGQYAEYMHAPKVWRAKKHSDGELAFTGKWFVLGIGKEEGEQITYHLPISRWNQTDFAETLDRAPKWDGHSSNDVLKRLKTLRMS